MKKLRQPRHTQRQFRRLILTSTILPSVLAVSAFGADWSGPVALDTSSLADDIRVLGDSVVTLTDTGGGPTANENSITFEPPLATETLTVNGAGLTLRSLATVLSIANNKTININGTADFAPGALSTGPVGTPLTGVVLQKTGVSGTLIFDTPTAAGALAGTTLRVLGGAVSLVGDGTNNPLSTLTTQITLGGTAPVFRVSSTGGDMTFVNSFATTENATIEHVTSTTDTLSTPAGLNPITAGKTLTVNVQDGGLRINGTMASPFNANGAGGTLKKMGVGTTLTLLGSVFVTNLNIAEGRVDVPGRFRMTPTNNIIFGANTTLSLTNQGSTSTTRNGLPATLIVPSGATLEGLPGAFVQASGSQSTLSLTGGTLNLGVGASAPGLVANLYTTGWNAAQGAFGGPQFPANTYATYTSYFAGIGSGTVTTTSAGGVTELSFDPAYGNTAMFQVLAPTYTRTDDIVARFSGKIVITTPGVYTFATDADDGSMLYINGATVVSNNASQAHTRRTGTVTLAAGLHDIDIGYYEGGGLNGLVVDYSGPDTGDIQTTMPNSVLLPISASTIQAFLNPVSVSQNSTINTAAGASVPSVTMTAGRTLNVNGYQMDMGTLVTGAAGTYTVNATTEFGRVCARAITDGGLEVDLVNSGLGMLVLESGASPQMQNALSSVTTGALGIVLGGAGGSPTGNAAVNVNGGSLMLSSKGGDQSYTPVGMSFSNGGSISAGALCSGVAGTVGAMIRTTLTPAITLNNATVLSLGSQDNYILRVAGISGGGSVRSLRGSVETSGAVNLTGTGQLTVENSLLQTLAGASAAAITVSNATLANTGLLTSASALSATNSTVSSTGNISATGAITVTDGTLTSGGTLSSGGAMDVTDSTVMSTGNISAGGAAAITASTVTSSGGISVTGSLTAIASTITESAGVSATSISLDDSRLTNTGPIVAPGGIILNATTSISTLELRGGSINGGLITATGGVIHATNGLTIANTSANFTGQNPTGLQGRFILTGGHGQISRGDKQSGILTIETGTNGLAEKVLNQPLNFPQDSDIAIENFFGQGIDTENPASGFAMGFFGNFTAPVSGLYSMQTGLVDDDAGWWVDLDGDGVFEGGAVGGQGGEGTPGDFGNELIARGGCCGDGPIGTVTLEAGRIYKVAMAVEDGQGGSGLVGRIALPGESMQTVDPSSPGQAGWWTYGLPNQVVVDVGAELRIRALNGDVHVIVNGDLDLTGAGNSTIDSLTIGAGGIATLGPAGAAAEGAALPVPEPGSLSLIVAGALGFFARRQRR
jgi:fibronectin-binding autotransporter adhesin